MLMMTHNDFRNILAETQVRSPEHLRLDTQFIYKMDMLHRDEYIQMKNNPLG